MVTMHEDGLRKIARDATAGANALSILRHLHFTLQTFNDGTPPMLVVSVRQNASPKALFESWRALMSEGYQ